MNYFYINLIIGKDDENKRGKDNAPYGEYGGWHKAAKVDR